MFQENGPGPFKNLRNICWEKKWFKKKFLSLRLCKDSGVLISCTCCALTIYQPQTLCQLLSSPQHHWSSGNWSVIINLTTLWPQLVIPMTALDPPDPLWHWSTFSDFGHSSIVGMGSANSTSGAGCIDRPTFRSSFKGHCTNTVMILSALKRWVFSSCELVFSGTIFHEWGALGLCGIYAEGDRNMNMDEGRGRLRGSRREGAMRTKNTYLYLYFDLDLYLCLCLH